MSRKKKTDLELLQILKKEIDRLEIEDNPSRTKMQEMYNKEVMPHPNTYVNRFGSWKEALRLIGIDYDGRRSASISTSEANKGKAYASTWSAMTEDEIVEAILTEIHEKGIKGAQDYQERRDRETTPSIPTVSHLTGLKWGDINELYRKRYGEEDVDSSLGVSKDKWSNMSDEELVHVVTQEMKRIGSDRYADYVEKRNKLETPSATTMANRGISWSKLKRLKK